MFPIDAIGKVVRYFRGDPSVTWQAAARALLDVLGFGLDQLGGQGQPLAVADQSLSEDQAVDRLEALAQAPEGAQQAVDPAVWAALLPVLAKLLAGWLSRRGN